MALVRALYKKGHQGILGIEALLHIALNPKPQIINPKPFT